MERRTVPPRRKSTAATIKDVAARAGVSIKTVSRVVNGEPHVVAATRTRVEAVVRELSYSPNASARNLSGSRSYLLGLFFDDPGSTYATDVHLGALSRARERGYHTVVERLDPASPDLERDVHAIAATLRLDGAVLTPPLCDDPRVLAALESAGVAYARIAPDRDPGRSPSVEMDDRAAAREMTAHLLGLGHRRIGFVKGLPSHGASRRRLDGHLDALASVGLEVDPALLAEGDFSFRSGVAAGESLLALGLAPTAIFASNDETALGVMAAAGRRGLTVPDALSVAGFDDTQSARVVWPQLTTIRQPKAEMAAAAVDLLIGGPDLSAGGTASRSLAFSLVARGSTGPPPDLT